MGRHPTLIGTPLSLCVTALRIRKRHQDDGRAEAPGDAWIDNGLVFTTRHGPPIEPRTPTAVSTGVSGPPVCPDQRARHPQDLPKGDLNRRTPSMPTSGSKVNSSVRLSSGVRQVDRVDMAGPAERELPASCRWHVDCRGARPAEDGPSLHRSDRGAADQLPCRDLEGGPGRKRKL